MYRLLIVNNPVTALFMAMELDSIKGRDNLINIILYESRILPDDYCSNPIEFESEARKFCLEPFQTENIIDLPGIYYHYFGFWDYVSKWPRIFIEQRENLKKLSRCLSSLSWCNNVAEIWHGNTMWQFYLRKYNRNSKLILFDHGLTETNRYLSQDKSFMRLRSLLKRIINFIYPVDPYRTPDAHFSLNADVINRVLNTDAANKIVLAEEHHRFFRRLRLGKYALILLDNIKPWSSQRSDHAEYFRAFEKYLVEHFVAILLEHGVESIILKSKHWHHEYASEAVKNFSWLRQYFKVFYFSDLHPNISAEYFMLDPSMCILAGNLSSSLFFAKSINPEIQTFTYDAWFTNYTLDKFGATYDEIPAMRKFYFKDYLWAFAEYNPKDI